MTLIERLKRVEKRPGMYLAASNGSGKLETGDLMNYLAGWDDALDAHNFSRLNEIAGTALGIGKFKEFDECLRWVITTLEEHDAL